VRFDQLEITVSFDAQRFQRNFRMREVEHEYFSLSVVIVFPDALYQTTIEPAIREPYDRHMAR